MKSRPPEPNTDQMLWIIKTDSMGCEISNCSVDISKAHSEKPVIQVFPNPFAFELNFIKPNEYENLFISITNSMGQEISKSTLKNEVNILDTHLFPEGLYILRIFEKSDLVSIIKIIKNNK